MDRKERERVWWAYLAVIHDDVNHVLVNKVAMESDDIVVLKLFHWFESFYFLGNVWLQLLEGIASQLNVNHASYETASREKRNNGPKFVTVCWSLHEMLWILVQKRLRPSTRLSRNLRIAFNEKICEGTKNCFSSPTVYRLTIQMAPLEPLWNTVDSVVIYHNQDFCVLWTILRSR